MLRTEPRVSHYGPRRGSVHSSGGKNRLGNISKQGDRYLRGLFVAGALSVIRYAKTHGTKHRPTRSAKKNATSNQDKNKGVTTPSLIRWSIQEVRRIAI